MIRAGSVQGRWVRQPRKEANRCDYFSASGAHAQPSSERLSYRGRSLLTSRPPSMRNCHAPASIASIYVGPSRAAVFSAIASLKDLTILLTEGCVCRVAGSQPQQNLQHKPLDLLPIWCLASSDQSHSRRPDIRGTAGVAAIGGPIDGSISEAWSSRTCKTSATRSTTAIIIFLCFDFAASMTAGILQSHCP